METGMAYVTMFMEVDNDSDSDDDNSCLMGVANDHTGIETAGGGGMGLLLSVELSSAMFLEGSDEDCSWRVCARLSCGNSHE